MQKFKGDRTDLFLNMWRIEEFLRQLYAKHVVTQLNISMFFSICGVFERYIALQFESWLVSFVKSKLWNLKSCKINAKFNAKYLRLMHNYVRSTLNSTRNYAKSTLTSTLIYKKSAIISMRKYIRSKLWNTKIGKINS